MKSDKRGHTHMTSAEFSDFLTPSPLVCKFTQLSLLRLLTKSAFERTPPSPLSEDVLNGSPLTHNIAGSTNITGSTNGLVTQKICVDGWMVDVASDGRERFFTSFLSRWGKGPFVRPLLHESHFVFCTAPISSHPYSSVIPGTEIVVQLNFPVDLRRGAYLL